MGNRKRIRNITHLEIMNKANFHAICLKIYEAVEELATQFNESQTGHVITVEHNFVEYRVTVDIIIENYDYDEDNNAPFYNTRIECSDIISVNNTLFTSEAQEALDAALVVEFNLETLYDDNN